MTNELKGVLIGCAVIAAIPVALIIMWLTLLMGATWLGYLATLLGGVA
jgi:hypothetical protein